MMDRILQTPHWLAKVNAYALLNYRLKQLDKAEERLTMSVRQLQEYRRRTVLIARDHNLEEWLGERIAQRMRQRQKEEGVL